MSMPNMEVLLHEEAQELFVKMYGGRPLPLSAASWDARLDAWTRAYVLGVAREPKTDAAGVLIQRFVHYDNIGLKPHNDGQWVWWPDHKKALIAYQSTHVRADSTSIQECLNTWDEERLAVMLSGVPKAAAALQESEVVLYLMTLGKAKLDGLLQTLPQLEQSNEQLLDLPTGQDQIDGAAKTYLLRERLCKELEQLAVRDHDTFEAIIEYLVDSPFSAEPIRSVFMLKLLAHRGGHPGALAEAALLCIRKSEDYSHGRSQEDPHKIDRSEYFPLGTASYAQMLHTKALRFVSLTRKETSGEVPNFEGLRDTALDIINYAGFYVAWLEQHQGAQDDKT